MALVHRGVRTCRRRTGAARWPWYCTCAAPVDCSCSSGGVKLDVDGKHQLPIGVKTVKTTGNCPVPRVEGELEVGGSRGRGKPWDASSGMGGSQRGEVAWLKKCSWTWATARRVRRGAVRGAVRGRVRAVLERQTSPKIGPNCSAAATTKKEFFNSPVVHLVHTLPGAACIVVMSRVHGRAPAADAHVHIDLLCTFVFNRLNSIS